MAYFLGYVVLSVVQSYAKHCCCFWTNLNSLSL